MIINPNRILKMSFKRKNKQMKPTTKFLQTSKNKIRHKTEIFKTKIKINARNWLLNKKVQNWQNRVKC